MDKNSAANQLANAGMSTYDVANSIYLATVEGVSGANQNGGYGFALSAIAELWNIRGAVGNPYGKTKITGRYKGMGITENMILDVVSQYPNGFRDNEPLFDDMLGIGSSRVARNYRHESINTSTGGEQNLSNIDIIIVAVAFVILKFFLGCGWIISIIAAFVIGTIADMIRRR